MSAPGSIAAWLGRLDAPAALLAGLAFLLALTLALAALAGILRARNALVARRWTAVERRWHDLLLHVIAGERPEAELHAMVRPGEARYLLEVVSRFARRLRGPERTRCAAVVMPYLPLLVAQASHRDPGLRARAVHALGLIGMERHADLVLDALDDPSDFVGMTAMRALARPAHAAHAPRLVARLDRFEAWDGGFLASVLAAIGPTVSPPLCGVLADDRRGTRVRWVAAEALCKLHHLPAGEIAASVAETSSNRDLVAACLRLLEATGHSGHLPVIRALVASADEVIRQQAVRALGTLEDPARMPGLVAHLADPSPWVGMEAGRALARFEGGRLLSPVAAGRGATATIAAQALMEARA